MANLASELCPKMQVKALRKSEARYIGLSRFDTFNSKSEALKISLSTTTTYFQSNAGQVPPCIFNWLASKQRTESHLLLHN